MALTKEQLETFSNTKPELRYLTEEIIKYLGALPASSPGGSSYLVYANVAAFPATGETLKIYEAFDTGVTYKWTGSAYVNTVPLVWNGLVNQSGADTAPTLIENKNTLGVSLTTSVVVDGQYRIIAPSGIFPLEKTEVFISPTNNGFITASNSENGEPSDQIAISTRNTSNVLAHSLLYYTSIEIKVYP